ncbi:hypothetical protein P7C73_g2061, partial [Tremellales sp. Uapishka_1]
MSYSRLIRFIPKSSPTSPALIGEPVDPKQDIGLATYSSEEVTVDVFSGSSILAPGERTGKTETVHRVLSPLASNEVGTIRCIGLNECNLAIPDMPVLFMKPSTALADPFPADTVIPRAVVKDEAADYESELAIVIGKTCKNVSEEDALDYLLGFTAANDVSSRKAQMSQSQWCFSKSFDGACPIGPAFVSKHAVSAIGDLQIKGSLNGEVVQESGLDDLIFSVPKIISFLSQGTTLPPGTIIITGTPAGVGFVSEPKRRLKEGDEFRVCVSHGVGTLINRIREEES